MILKKYFDLSDNRVHIGFSSYKLDVVFEYLKKYFDYCKKCANDHEQLADWLEELKQYRAIGTVEDCKAAMEERKGGTMREILFRAKRADNDELVTGYLLKMWNMWNIQNYENENIVYAVDGDTVCQYTGSTDIDGEMIFEGDILQANENQLDIYKVCFGEFGVVDMETENITDRAVGWYLKVIQTEDVFSRLEPFNMDLPLNSIWIENCRLKVIGNIFDDTYF